MESPAGPALERFVLDFAHPVEPVRALVRPHDSVQRIGECWIGFLTLRVDGPSIVTVAHAEVEIGKDTTDLDVEVMFGADAAVLLNRHRERVAAATQAGAWFVDANNRAVALHLQWLDASGIALPPSGLGKTLPPPRSSPSTGPPPQPAAIESTNSAASVW